MNPKGPQFYGVAPVTPMVKKLLIVTIAIWLVGVMILQNMIIGSPLLIQYFGLSPLSIIFEFHIWQPISYMFLHSSENIFHVVFNMLILWMFGAELERRWGATYFLKYYLVSGVGAGLIYCLCVFLYYMVTKDAAPFLTPVIGASGAIFGLLVAYGVIFSERVVYFLMIFPMKAKYFVLIIAGIEVLNLLSYGFKSDVANLAHLAGAISGYLYLVFSTRRTKKKSKKIFEKSGRKLKLVVNNDKKKEGPKYWN